MKKLLLLTVTILANLIAFSQIGTRTITTNKDSIVTLPKNVAKEVAKDLIRKDSLTMELNIVKKNVELFQSNLSAKDSIINLKNNQLLLYTEKEKNYELMLKLKDAEKYNLEVLIKKLNADLKKTKRKLATRTIGSTVIIGALTYLILK